MTTPNDNTVSPFPTEAAQGAAGPGLRKLAPETNKSDLIASHLRQAILSGTYRYGERLPAERALAETFGAARSTVRDALRKLENDKFVTRRVGSGTYVSYSSANHEVSIVDKTTPLELIEVRLAIEPRIAKLAAINATAKDLENLEQAMLKAEGSSRDPENFTQWDEAFHHALAECSKNALLIWIYRQINEIRNHDQWTEMRDKILTPDCMNDYNDQHRLVVEAIRLRDIEGAERAMIQHLERARGHLLGVVNGQL